MTHSWPPNRPPSGHLPGHLKANETKALATLPTSNEEIAERGVKIENIGQGTTIGDEVARVARNGQKPLPVKGPAPAPKYNVTRDKGSASASMFIASVDAGLERIYPAENPKPKGRMVALNESGTQRIGEDHHRAKLTDAQVEAMREDHERHPVGHPEYMGYRTLAKKYGCSKSTVRDVVNYMKRNQWAVRWSVPRAYRRKHKIP